MPENISKFSSFKKQFKFPIVIYADFKRIPNPIQYSQPNETSSFIIRTLEHIPFPICFYNKCSFDDNLSKLAIHYPPL